MLGSTLLTCAVKKPRIHTSGNTRLCSDRPANEVSSTAHTATIPGRPDDTGQHARQWRAVGRGVAPPLPPPRSHAERRSWPDHIPGADVRSILVAQQGGGAYSSSPNTLPVDRLIRWNRVQA